MSYITYLGLPKSIDAEILLENKYNFMLDEIDSIETLESLRPILKSPYVYECMTLRESAINFDWENNVSFYGKKFNNESTKSFLDLCSFLCDFLKPNENAILFCYWLEDSSGEIEEKEMDLKKIDIKEINITHKTLLILSNSGN